MLLYYITDRKQFLGSEREQRAALVQRIAEAAQLGVNYIQLREKDLAIGELERLGQECLEAVRNHSSTTRLLVNSRTDVALAIGADGVHLTSQDMSASDARAVWAASIRNASSAAPSFTISVSCHSVEEVRSAESHGADFAVLAPIFEKPGTAASPLGLDAVRAATLGQAPDLRVEAGDNRVGIPVLALGGVTVNNSADCLRAGAAGVAGIRLFQAGNLADTVAQLRQARG